MLCSKGSVGAYGESNGHLFESRWRHVSRNWLGLHIVTPLSESIKLLGDIEKQQI